ncbi:hypothetical protein [Pseudomonas sp. NA-150]|uniref:hypothetical protein n=1 Tax=Pseudomonas sp. NA-150 TaxID=3367525 RepID=UPI0037C824F4
MSPSVTYLHLLRHTPFFVDLDKEQLRWVIDHSHEWQAQPGTVITRYEQGAPVTDDIWVLLDGGWQVEADGEVYRAGHADPGKWYSAADVAHPSRLVATETSYVMRIKRSEMQQMLNEGFAFNSHLQAGSTYYRKLFPAQP